MIPSIFLFSLITIAIQPDPLYQFTTASNTNDWRIVNDVVMGGKSSASLHINAAGKGVFEGYVSLENNGGFSSLRYRLNKEGIKPNTTLVLKIKGDGKKYQFRIKDKLSNYYSYTSSFTSSTEWEIIKIPLAEMYPTFRGRTLNIPNYKEGTIEEIAFLIGNKRAESFKLEIDFIGLE